MPAQPPLELEAHAEGPILVVNALLGEGDAQQAAFSALWRFSSAGTAPTCLFDRSEEVPGDLALALDRVLIAALGQYLDAHLRFGHDGVRPERPVNALIAELEAILRSGVEAAGSPADVSLSAPTRAQLTRYCALDWSRAHSGVAPGPSDDRYLAIYRFVRDQRTELERQLRADLLPLSAVDVLARPGDPGRQLRINSTCGTVFDSENFLCALDLGLSGADSLDRSMVPALDRGAVLTSEPVPPRRMRKRDRWIKEEFDAIHERIDRADQRRELWELRDRVEDIEDRLSAVELEARERATPENALAELGDLAGRPLVIRFERGGTTLAPADVLLLSEVLDQLAHNPQHRLLITGHADRVGDPVVNLWISERRARAVRDHLLRRGIAPERLLVNFLGDSRSSGPDPGERRVEIEWLR
ncbi:MAG: OmpA family protein [Flavobacteriales bacterium]|nr:OmpA family protein [Flavobacteriales bacterium]